MSIPNFDYHIIDTFEKYDTRSLLCGVHFSDYHKRILREVIRYYANKSFHGTSQTECAIIEYLQSIFDKQPNISYDELMKLFNAKSNECLLAYILIAYNNTNIDIILRCMYTFCRVLPFKKPTEWYDNYRLNNYGNPLNMIMWHDYDCNDVYTISDSFPNDIDKSVKLDFNVIVKRFVGSLRAFIIDHGLFPSSSSSDDEKYINGGQRVTSKPFQSSLLDIYESFLSKRHNKRKSKLSKLSGGDIEAFTSDSSVHPFRENKHDSLSRGLTAEQICDECYRHYPYFYGGAHGCDFYNCGLCPDFEQHKLFLKRYPSARIGYILNTATYRSGHGEHWVALQFDKENATLICSQGSSFSAFHDGGELYRNIQQAPFGEIYNPTTFQVDGYSCGIFSALSLYWLLILKDPYKVANKIGENGSQIKPGMNINDIRELWAGTFESSKKA